MLNKEQIADIVAKLKIMHANAICELDYNTPYELLVAVVLSAQCTDKRVNTVTKELFKYADTPEKMLELPIDELKCLIHSVGCFNRKSELLKRLSRSILDNYGGEVPRTVDELIKLDGVGRKTANVVYSVAFGGNAIAVDTHVQRVSNRIGLVNTDKPEDTEKGLMQCLDEKDWSEAHHLLIHHGRYVCKARSPQCAECLLSDICRYYGSERENGDKRHE